MLQSQSIPVAQQADVDESLAWSRYLRQLAWRIEQGDARAQELLAELRQAPLRAWRDVIRDFEQRQNRAVLAYFVSLERWTYQRIFWRAKKTYNATRRQEGREAARRRALGLVRGHFVGEHWGPWPDMAEELASDVIAGELRPNAAAIKMVLIEDIDPTLTENFVRQQAAAELVRWPHLSQSLQNLIREFAPAYR